MTGPSAKSSCLQCCWSILGHRLSASGSLLLFRHRHGSEPGGIAEAGQTQTRVIGPSSPAGRGRLAAMRDSGRAEAA